MTTMVTDLELPELKLGRIGAGPQTRDLMAGLAEQNGLVLTVHQNRRWDGDFLAVKRVLDEGKLGNVVMVQSSVGYGPYTKRSGWGARKAFTGGGAFLSFGPHLIDRILSISPSGPIYVHGLVRSILNEEDYFCCSLEFAGGWTAQIEVSRASRIPADGWAAAQPSMPSSSVRWRTESLCTGLLLWTKSERCFSLPRRRS